jgi:hypothetical protein
MKNKRNRRKFGNQSRDKGMKENGKRKLALKR